MRPITTTVVCLLALFPVPRVVASDWLPADVREAMAQEIARRITAVDVEGTVAEEARLEGARTGIAAIAARVESLGMEPMLELAPEFPELGVPVSRQPHLDAIGRFGLCSFSTDSIYADDTPRERGTEQRITASIMSMSIVIASAYLRDFYLAAGASDEDARAYLAGEAMNKIANEIQASEELLQYTMDQCAEPLSQLLGPPVRE